MVKYANSGFSDMLKPAIVAVDSTLPSEAASAFIDYALLVSLVFGGCCTNAWSLETLLKQGSSIGSALTFLQMSFITVQALPSFVTFQQAGNELGWIPRLKSRAVPLATWLVQVVLLVSMSLLNNWAFTYRVPLTVQIVVRSSGLAMSVLFGYFSMHKKYTSTQILAVLLVTSGVVIATLSGPLPSHAVAVPQIREYFIGISMLVLASVLAAYYGVLQERTYARYGPHWKEGIFYTHLLSLPTFAFLSSDVWRGISSLTQSSKATIPSIPNSYFILALNLATQLLCTASVNKLTSTVSSVTTNLVLTARKALSLCLSVWWFGNGWNNRLGAGASMVFLGTILYTFARSRVEKEKVQ